MDIIIKTVLIGVGATLLMDIWSQILKLFNIKSLDYRFVGRWIGYFFKGTYSHSKIFESKPIKYELLIGWMSHYLIGIMFAFLLIVIYGSEWLTQPTLLPALIIGVLTIIAPFFVMQPAFGMGIASSKLEDANILRFRSLITHTIFGLGLYVSAILLNLI